MIRTLRAAGTALLASSLLSLVVQAQQPRDPPAAEAMFLRGRAAMEAGRLAEACASFAESYRLDAAVGTLLNQAQCEEQSGLLAEAWEHFRTAAEQLPPTDERQALARQRAAALDPRVPRLTIVLAPSPEGTRVRRDRVELREASLGVALPLNPGKHLIEVLAPGHEPRSWTIDIAEGARRELPVEPGPLRAAPPAASSSVPLALPPPTAPPRPSTRRTVGWAAGSVGATALLASIGVGAWAYQRSRYVRDQCPNNQCTVAGLQASGELRSLSNVSTGAFIVGALGLGAGAYLLLTGEF